MENLQTLPLTELLDRLASYTEQYTRSYSEQVSPEELETIKSVIISLQEEIQKRNANAG